ncbi:MAG: hypothetical protein ACK2UW_06130, partial [Anaerolineales bacterium]
AGALFTTIRVIGVTFQDVSASLPEIDEPKWLRWPVIIAIVWMFAGGLLPGLFLSLLVRLIV